MKKRFCDELVAHLTENILPYWLERMQDPRGGFYGRRDGHDRLDPAAPKGAVLNARILWSFSAAYRVLRRPEYLAAATRAKREIIDRFYDAQYGGVYWSVDSLGRPADTRKQFYALGFAVYGLSEYARATGDREALDYALRLFGDIETHSRDRVRGGYIEAATRTWQPVGDMRLSAKDANAAKTMNTHLHIIEPYVNLLRVVPGNAALREAVASLLDIFFDRIRTEGGHLGLFFDVDWRRQDAICSYGHDIEASWLLLEAAEVLGDKALSDKALQYTAAMASAALEGRCADGSMIYERDADGRRDCDRHWWVQAEAVIGQVYLYLFHHRAEMLRQAFETWRYIRENLVDPEAGEWYWSRTARGTVNRNDDKAGFWKCPYHNTRMCLEVFERLAGASAGRHGEGGLDGAV